MKSNALPSFWEGYNRLPEHIRKLANKNFKLFIEKPSHPSLGFKKKGGVHTRDLRRLQAKDYVHRPAKSPLSTSHPYASTV